MTFNEYKQKYNIKLNEQQEKAVQAVDGNVLLLAVPGSGKTTVLVARLGYMIYACGIAPENILTMTYTVAAANDMKRRFIAKFGDEFSDRLVFRTINSICYNIIWAYSTGKGSKAFDVIEETDRSTLLSRIFREVNNDFATDLQKKTLGVDITYVKNMMLSAEDILEYKADGYDNFSKIYDRYNQELRRMGKMDYDDQLIYTYTILTKYPGILKKYRDKYKYICVDEAQDTSKIQHEIIKLLAAGYGDNISDSNYFAVGDEDQSIYGFRAAYPEALYNFERDYKNAKVLLMEKNYRSTRAIVDAADRFIQKNQNRHPKYMVANRDEDGEPVKFESFTSRGKQYEQIMDFARNCDVQTAILFHDNDSSIPIINLLNKEGIGYRARGLDSLFFSSPVVLDIIGIINFALENCVDQEFFEKNYYKLGLFMKKNQVEYVLKFCPKGKNIIEYLAQNKFKNFPDRLVDNAKDALEAFEVIRNADNGADIALGAIVYDLKYKAHLDYFHLPSGALNILEQIAKGETTAAGMLKRLDELKGIMAAGGTDKNSNFVLSTVHSSKGLEYDRVIIIDGFEGNFPKADKNEDRDAYEEERRLFYVAMTRAKNKLILYTYNMEECPFQDEVKGNLKTVTVESKPSQIRLGSKSNAIEDKLQRGVKLEHKAFGKGVVVDRSSDKNVLIEFDRGFKKDLSVEILLRNRLIKYIEEEEEPEQKLPRWMYV